MNTRVFGVAIAMATIWGWHGTAPSAASPPVVAPLIGLTVASRTAVVAPEQAGKIVSLPFEVGDRVVKDQVLFQLNGKLQELEVDRLRPLAESNLVQLRAEADLAHALRQERRIRDLRDQDIASDSDLQAQEHEVLIARLKLQQAGIEMAQAKNQLAQAIERLDQRVVKSPFKGIVTQRMKSEGESVERFVPVLEVMSFDPLWVEFDCPMHRQGDYPVGSKIQVAPSFRDDDVRVGVVTYQSMKANASSHTLSIRAAVPNPERDWRSGQKMLILEPGTATAEPTPKPGK